MKLFLIQIDTYSEIWWSESMNHLAYQIRMKSPKDFTLKDGGLYYSYSDGSEEEVTMTELPTNISKTTRIFKCSEG